MTRKQKDKLKQSIKAKLIAYAKMRDTGLLEAGSDALSIALSLQGKVSLLEKLDEQIKQREAYISTLDYLIKKQRERLQ